MAGIKEEIPFTRVMSSNAEKQDFPLPTDKIYLKSLKNRESNTGWERFILHHIIRKKRPEIPELYEK